MTNDTISSSSSNSGSNQLSNLFNDINLDSKSESTKHKQFNDKEDNIYEGEIQNNKRNGYGK